MKKSVIFVAVFAAVLAASAAFAADGVINMDAVFANYPAFAQARQQIEAAAQQKAATIKAEKDTAKQQQLAQQAQRDLFQQEQKLMTPVFKAVNDAINKVAKAKKLEIVHPAAIVLYGGVDITQDVINALK